MDITKDKLEKSSKIKDIFRRKEERKRKLQESLSSLVQSLKELGAEKVILFGSLARGEVDVNSDIDLFVIMPSFKSGKEWMNLIYEKIERGVAATIIAYNQDEFSKNLPSSRFLQNILNGKVLYEKAG